MQTDVPADVKVDMTITSVVTGGPGADVGDCGAQILSYHQDPLIDPLDPPSRACTGALCHSLTPTLSRLYVGV